MSVIVQVKHGDDRSVIARTELALHDAGDGLVCESLARKHQVEAPADVALPHVPPRRPPGEELGILRLHLPVNIDQPVADDLLEKRPFIGALTDDVRLALLRDARPCQFAQH